MDTVVRPPTPETLALAARLIREGDVVAFPTETVYGLGAHALDASAVARIFAAKQRPPDNPLIAHVLDIEGAAALWADIPPRARKLIEAFWPGPLTLVLPHQKGVVPGIVTAGLDTLAVRSPAHPAARALLSACGLPIAAPSANRSGRPSPTEAAHVLDDLTGRVPLIIDGGPCERGVESTVLDLSGPPALLRPGSVTREAVEAVLGERVLVAQGVLAPLAAGQAARSPGLLHRHYAPDAEMLLFSADHLARAVALYDASPEKSPVFLAYDRTIPLLSGRDAYPLGADDDRAAAALFSCLRRAEAGGKKLILAEIASGEGVGLAVMNRMLRAAGFRVIK